MTGRTVSRKRFTVDVALERGLANVRGLRGLFYRASLLGVSVVRISSDLFPRITDSAVPSYSLSSTILSALADVGAYARSLGIRVLMHPGQFHQLGSLNDGVVASTLRSLEHSSAVLDAMGVDAVDGVMILHVGGAFGDTEATLLRWLAGWRRLSSTARARVVLENCERFYGASRLVSFCESHGIRMVYDCHHDAVYSSSLSALMRRVVATWPVGERPIMHVSEQAAGKRLGAHSELVSCIPAHILAVARVRPLDLEVEAKGKEVAVHHLLKWVNASQTFSEA